MVTYIGPNGKVLVFHVMALAEVYQRAYGGTLVQENAARALAKMPSALSPI